MRSWFRWDIEILTHQARSDLFEGGLKFGLGWNKTDTGFIITGVVYRLGWAVIADQIKDREELRV